MKKVFALIGTVLPVLCASLLTNPKFSKAEATETPIQYIGDLYRIKMVSSRTKVIINDPTIEALVMEAGRTIEREVVPGFGGGVGGDLPPIIERPGIRRSKPTLGPVFQDYQYYYYATPTEPIILGKVAMYNTKDSLKTAIEYLEDIADFYGYTTNEKNNSVLGYIRSINKTYLGLNWTGVAGNNHTSFIQAVNSLTSIGSMNIRDYFASFIDSKYYNSSLYGDCGEYAVNNFCLYDPFTKKADIDIIHMFGSMDGIFEKTSDLTLFTNLFMKKSTISYLVSWAGDLQTAATNTFTAGELNIVSFETVFNGGFGFPYSDFYADVDAYLIACKQSLDNFVLSDEVYNYYSSPKTTSERIEQFYVKTLTSSIDYKTVNHDNLRKLIYEMMALNSNGTDMSKGAKNSEAGKRKYAFLRYEDASGEENFVDADHRKHISLLFYDYLIKAMSGSLDNDPLHPDPGLVTGDRFD